MIQVYVSVRPPTSEGAKQPLIALPVHWLISPWMLVENVVSEKALSVESEPMHLSNTRSMFPTNPCATDNMSVFTFRTADRPNTLAKVTAGTSLPRIISPRMLNESNMTTRSEDESIVEFNVMPEADDTSRLFVFRHLSLGETRL